MTLIKITDMRGVKEVRLSSWNGTYGTHKICSLYIKLFKVKKCNLKIAECLNDYDVVNDYNNGQLY